MATEKLYSGDGSDKTFDITFPYLTHADIKVSLKELKSDATSPYSADDYHYKDKADPGDYSISGNTVTFTTAPPTGTGLLENNIKITRATVITSPEHEYAAGSSITAASLNENQKQALYAIEEAGEITATPGGISTGDKGPIFVSSDSSWSMQANSIANTHLQDNSVDTNEIKTNAVTADEIAANAVGSSELADNAVDTNAIQDEAVTYAKMQNMADANRVLGRPASGGSQVREVIITDGMIADLAATQAKIDNQAVNEAKLQISNNPTNGYVLTAQSGNTGGLTWATPISIKPAGSVLETFTLCCTGTSAVVSSGTYQTQNVQAAQDVNTTGGWVTLNGSQMAYTPPADTKTVVYKFNYFVRPNNSNNHILYHTSLMLDTDEVTAAKYSPYINSSSTQMSQHFEWPFIIRSSDNLSIGQMSSWTSAKTIKILVKAYSDGYTSRFHDMAYWDSNPAVTMHRPTISITAIS